MMRKLLERQFTADECRERNATDPRIHEGWNCRWVAPFGWVPEADCPVHDAPPAHTAIMWFGQKKPASTDRI